MEKEKMASSIMEQEINIILFHSRFGLLSFEG